MPFLVLIMASELALTDVRHGKQVQLPQTQRSGRVVLEGRKKEKSNFQDN